MESRKTIQFHTSLLKLDEALGVDLGRGRLILCAGITGGGKTILAAQLSRQFVLDGANVLYVSTEVDPGELHKRNMSAACSIPYDQVMDRIHTVVIDGPGGIELPLPDPEKYGYEVVNLALPVLATWGQRCKLIKIASLGFSPHQELAGLLESYQRKCGCYPDALVYDYLWYPKSAGEGIDEFKMREAVIDAAEALKQAASNHDMLVVAFCQARVNESDRKMIDPSGIAEFKSIMASADAFVGISQRQKSDDDDLEDGLYERTQHLHVVRKGGASSILVPVKRTFEFQRFDGWQPRTRRTPETDLGELEQKARLIEKMTEFPGYVLARRGKLQELFESGALNAVNLYVFLLIVAKTKGAQRGSSFYSRRRLTEFLGLSSKQLRHAMDVLMDRGFIDVPEGTFRQSLHYIVDDWSKDQDPSETGYFKLFRNLREESRADLLANPDVLRAWIYVLSQARGHPDETLELAPGELLFKAQPMTEILQLTGAQLTTVIDKLVDRGSLVRTAGPPAKLWVPNWRLYQTKVYPSSRTSGENQRPG